MTNSPLHDSHAPSLPEERRPQGLRPSLRAARFIVSLPSRFLIGCVRLYQMTLSPLLGANCRFVPSCSEYFIQAVKKYGAVSGAVRGTLRICRCHPFHPGGYDPP